MGKRRTLTLQLDEDVIRKAKVLAAQRSTSSSGLVAQEITRLVNDEDEYLAAKREALAILEHGFDLGGDPLPSREELHQRS